MIASRTTAGLALLTSLALLGAACGSSDSDTATTQAAEVADSDGAVTTSAGTDEPGSTDDSGGAGSIDDFDATVDEHIAALSAPQEETPPTEGPAAVPGKKISLITFTAAEAGAQRIISGLEEAAELLGWETTLFDGQANPNTVNDRFQQAIAGKPDAIVIIAVDAALIQGGLEDAAAAGIPVACNTCADLADPLSNGPFATIDPAVSRFADMGYATSEWAYRATDGKPKFVATNDASLSNLLGRELGLDDFVADCEAAGGDCEVLSSEPFLVANLNTTFGAKAAGMARANPDYNVFWVPFDFAALQVISGLDQAGLTGGDKIVVASNGDAANLDVIANGGEQPVTVAISFEWGGFATMDNLNRLFAGEPNAEQNIPIRLFDSTNVAEAAGGAWDGDVDFRELYRQVWQA